MEYLKRLDSTISKLEALINKNKPKLKIKIKKKSPLVLKEKKKDLKLKLPLQSRHLNELKSPLNISNEKSKSNNINPNETNAMNFDEEVKSYLFPNEDTNDWETSITNKFNESISHDHRHNLSNSSMAEEESNCEKQPHIFKIENKSFLESFTAELSARSLSTQTNCGSSEKISDLRELILMKNEKSLEKSQCQTITQSESRPKQVQKNSRIKYAKLPRIRALFDRNLRKCVMIANSAVSSISENENSTSKLSSQELNVIQLENDLRVANENQGRPEASTDLILNDQNGQCKAEINEGNAPIFDSNRQREDENSDEFYNHEKPSFCLLYTKLNNPNSQENLIPLECLTDQNLISRDIQPDNNKTENKSQDKQAMYSLNKISAVQNVENQSKEEALHLNSVLPEATADLSISEEEETEKMTNSTTPSKSEKSKEENNSNDHFELNTKGSEGQKILIVKSNENIDKIDDKSNEYVFNEKCQNFDASRKIENNTTNAELKPVIMKESDLIKYLKLGESMVITKSNPRGDPLQFKLDNYIDEYSLVRIRILPAESREEYKGTHNSIYNLKNDNSNINSLSKSALSDQKANIKKKYLIEDGLNEPKISKKVSGFFSDLKPEFNRALVPQTKAPKAKPKVIKSKTVDCRSESQEMNTRSEQDKNYNKLESNDQKDKLREDGNITNKLPGKEMTENQNDFSNKSIQENPSISLSNNTDQSLNNFTVQMPTSDLKLQNKVEKLNSNIKNEIEEKIKSTIEIDSNNQSNIIKVIETCDFSTIIEECLQSMRLKDKYSTDSKKDSFCKILEIISKGEIEMDERFVKMLEAIIKKLSSSSDPFTCKVYVDVSLCINYVKDFIELKKIAKEIKE